MLVKPGIKVSLHDHDSADRGEYASADDAEETLKAHLKELGKLHNLLYAECRRSILIILQGMDTSGKDGTIRHVMAGLSPLGVQVWAFKAPSREELAHDFLWRIHQRAPARGTIGIFNRSHYEDVLVARVHDLVPKHVWKERYEQINDFERMLVENYTIILKFFLHISKDEQRKRLQERLDDPTRYWKFSLDDIKERKHWAAYRKAYEAALTHCGTAHAPWHIVPANHKWYRNLVVAETLVETLRSLKMKYPPPSVDLSKVVVD